MSLGNWGQSFLRDAAGGFFGSEYLRDFRHAEKVFRTNSYQNAPKLKFLYHTYFDTNTDVFPNSFNFGLLVKTISLPNFKFDTETLNQYNRKRIVQTKLKYGPIDIVFHDDNNDSINALWNAYYKYYYTDGSKIKNAIPAQRGSALSENLAIDTSTQPANNFNSRNIYDTNIDGDWGYNGSPIRSGLQNEESIGINPDPKTPFFRSITIFGLSRHNFTAYTLINPIITDFRHDTYDYSAGNGIMEAKMTIDYETVIYNYGALDGRKPGEIVAGFGDYANYDRTVSPIARPGANGTILGQGGLVDGAGGTVGALRNGNILGAVQNAGRTIRTATRGNIGQILGQENAQALRNEILNTPNTRPRQPSFSFPGNGSSPGPVATNGFPVINARQSPPIISRVPTAQAAPTTAGRQNTGSGAVEPAPIAPRNRPSTPAELSSVITNADTTIRQIDVGPINLPPPNFGISDSSQSLDRRLAPALPRQIGTSNMPVIDPDRPSAPRIIWT